MNYHIVIQQERRVSTDAAPRQLAFRIGNLQLHTMGESVADLTSPQIVYAATWDLVSPYIVVLKGDNSALKMRFAEWPAEEQPA